MKTLGIRQRIRCLECGRHFMNPTPFELMEHYKEHKREKRRKNET
jgi:hypothetical protein